MDVDVRNRSFRMTVATTIFVLNAVVAGIAFSLSDLTGKPFASAAALVSSGVIPMVVLGYLMLEPNKKAVQDFLNNSLWEKRVTSVNKGDARIGIDKETNKPVVIPYKDRFLHMLILGPTGSGKTSQIITPLIYADIKNREIGVICMEPKGDLAEKVYALSMLEGREAIYFNPTLRSCPYFNPLMGDETDVIENMVTTFKMLDPDSSTFFQDNNENLIRRSIKVLKRLEGDDATLQMLDMFINNVKGIKGSGNGIGGFGDTTVNKFEVMNKNETNPRIKKENEIIISWFRDEYFPGSYGLKNAPKTYEHCSGVRGQISKLISNKYLSRVLNPPRTSDLKPGQYLDFDTILKDGLVCCISSEQGKLRDLGRFLGYFLILQLQASVFRRPGNEFTRRGCTLYIDEFQVYANSGFSDMLTMGRSYRVASHLATQNRALIGMNSGKSGKGFLDLVSTNARNVILFPGANGEDAKYYSQQFGEDLVYKEKRSISRDKASLANFGRHGSEKESISSDEKYEARVRSTDITYRKFGEVVYSIIQNDTLQRPGVCTVQFIPKSINDEAKKFLDKYNTEQSFTEDELQEIEHITNEQFSLDVEDIDDSGYDSYADEQPVVDKDSGAADPFGDLLG